MGSRSHQQISKWASVSAPQRHSKWNLAPRGMLLYFPLAISLGLNSLWLSNWLSRAPADVAPEQSSVNVPKLVVNGEVCGGGMVEETQNQFFDVVLVISFKDDSTARNASDFLRDVYGRFFKAVVACAPSEDEELGIESRGYRSWGKHAAYQYYFFPKVAARYPEAAGFLWITADVVLNYWNLNNADKNKLWLVDAPRCSTCKQGFVAFNVSEGEDVSTQNPLESLPQRKGTAAALKRAEAEYRTQFEVSILPKTGAFPTRIGDVFYVPQRLAYKLAFNLIPAFRDYSVFQDIAIPTMFFALEAPSEYDPVLNEILYFPDNSGVETAEEWSKDPPAFHPWPLSSLRLRAKLLRTLGGVDRCLQKLLEAASSS